MVRNLPPEAWNEALEAGGGRRAAIHTRRKIWRRRDCHFHTLGSARLSFPYVSSPRSEEQKSPIAGFLAHLQRHLWRYRRLPLRRRQGQGQCSCDEACARTGEKRHRVAAKEIV